MFDVLFYTTLGLFGIGLFGLLSISTYRIIAWLIQDWRKNSWRHRILDVLFASLSVGAVGFFILATIVVSQSL